MTYASTIAADTTSPRPLFDAAGDRIGEQLAKIVRLSRHDVEEILSEQASNHKRFGQIALAWGLCEPKDVWQAWSSQIVGRTPRVDLAHFGIDAQATSELPAWLAAAVGAVPVRSTEGRLVVAASERSLPRAIEMLTARTTKPVSFVVADAGQIEEAVGRYYRQATAPVAADPCGGRRCGSACKGEACPARRKIATAPRAAVTCVA